MKARVVVVALVGLVSFPALSQENDDVYFSKKDRQKAEAKLPKVLNKLDQDANVYASLPKFKVNSANGYTGRTINPDYQGSWETGTDVSSYFIPDYQPATANGNLNQFPSMYSQGGGFGSFGNRWGMRGMYSPFNSGFGYSPFGYSSFGYSPFGYSSYGYNPYGMYDPFMSGYNSWGYNPYSSWGNSYGYGSGFGYGYGCNFGYGSGLFGGSYFGQPIFAGNFSDNNVPRTQGKRSSRNDGVVSNSSMSRGSQVVSGGQTNPTRGGRVATTNTGTSTTNRYYQRGWRQDPTINPSAGTSTGSRSTGWVGGTGTSSGRSTSTWGNTNTGTNRNWNNDSFGGGSRSSGTSFGTGGGGSRSSGSSGTSGGGGTRSSGGGGRGRN